MNRKGQFYLIAAVIIVAIILGFVAVQNTTKKKSTTILYDLGEELNFEGAEVLEWQTLPDREDSLDQFIKEYSDFAGEDGRTIYFIVGNRSSVSVFAYEDVQVGSISITLGEGNPREKIVENVFIETHFPGEEGRVVVIIKDIEYEFNLEEGENFLFVISQEIDGETHVTQS